MTGFLGFHNCNFGSWNIRFHSTCRELKPVHEPSYSAFAKNQTSFARQRATRKMARQERLTSGGQYYGDSRDLHANGRAPTRPSMRQREQIPVSGSPPVGPTQEQNRNSATRCPQIIKVAAQGPSFVPLRRYGPAVAGRFARAIRFVPIAVAGVVSWRTPARLQSSARVPLRGVAGLH